MGKASRRKRETREALEAMARDPEVRKEFERVALQAVREKLGVGNRLRVAPAGASRRGTLSGDGGSWSLSAGT